ncbi:MAG: choice-of-anchor tandem repeat GloVer-containing protein [Candidatus Cybelea sp.]
MSNLSKIAGACLCAALLAACAGAGTSVFPTTKTLLVPLSRASGKSVLYRFKGYSHRDGQDPEAGLTAVNGMLYGTTAGGGGAKCGRYPGGCGTVYRISPSGGEHVLYRFKGAPDGMFPSANLLAMDGALYGTTAGGGENNAGTVFAVDSNTGAESVVYNFRGQDAGDGAYPRGGLIALNGVLYGTATQGGSAKCNNVNTRGCGIVFSVTTSGTERVLHIFKGGGGNQNKDGGYPYAGLTAMNGLLYGTTNGGGRYSGSCDEGCGSVFEMSPSGNQYRVLYRFKGGRDGVAPNAGLVNLNGNFYGATAGGGGSACVATGFGCGTIFEMNASGRERILHRFMHGLGGSAPNDLIVVGDTLYGTTAAGGGGGCQGYGCGSVFRLNSSGRDYAVLHGFLGSPDGSEPSGLLEVNGMLYGTTAYGGRCSHGCIKGYGGFGTVFELTP